MWYVCSTETKIMINQESISKRIQKDMCVFTCIKRIIMAPNDLGKSYSSLNLFLTSISHFVCTEVKSQR